MAARSSRSPRSMAATDPVHAAYLDALARSLPDGCRDAQPFGASMPRRGRLDLADRAVVVTQRLGGTLLLQRIGFNAYQGVAAELVEPSAAGKAPTVRLVLRHAERTHCVVLADALPLEDAVAVWRGWADRLSVGMLLADETGADSTVRAMLGAVMVGTRQPRRAGRLVRRRPRFAKRRALR